MGIIYVLTCHTTDEKYIGSTMKTLEERYRRHKSDKSCISRHIIARNNHSIKQLEVFETDDRKKLEKREQYWMDIIPNINMRRAYTSIEKRKEMNKIKCSKYIENNKQVIRDYAKQYYYDNYKKSRQGDMRRKAWRRSWKPDCRMGFYNDFLLIKMDLFE